MRLHLSIIVVFFFLLTGCNKNNLDQNCQKLKSAITNGNSEQAEAAISAFINQLLDQTHTSQNLEQLAKNIDSECDIDAVVLCYGCIQTLPEQSEIKLSFQTTNTTIHKVIDITHTQSNKMKFRNMHD